MLDLREVRSLTDFQRNAKQHLQHAQETRKPIVLTVNGKAAAVLQDAEAYQELLDRLEYAESVAAIREGIEECDRGEAQPARDALNALRAKYDIPR